MKQNTIGCSFELMPSDSIHSGVMEEKGNPNSIKLPDTLEIFRNLRNAKQFAIDIGA